MQHKTMKYNLCGERSDWCAVDREGLQVWYTHIEYPVITVLEVVRVLIPARFT